MVVWIWWAAITRLCVQWLEHILRWHLRIRLGMPSKSRLLFPLNGGPAARLIKIVFVARWGSGRSLTGLPFARGLWTIGGVAWEFVCSSLSCALGSCACRGRENGRYFLSLRPRKVSLYLNWVSGWWCEAAPGGHHSSCCMASLSWPALALCTDNLTSFDKRNVPLCLQLLNFFFKLPFWTALAEGRVIASAVGALCLICAVTASVANLTTHGTGLSSSASIFAVTEFLAFKAAQWVW